MPDDFITKREFDGFTTSMRNDFQRLAEQWTQALSKLDTLLNGRIEEARVMGEISSDIRAIRERQERQEQTVQGVERTVKAQEESFRKDIDKLWDENAKLKDAEIGRWWQIALYVFAALTGGVITAILERTLVK